MLPSIFGVTLFDQDAAQTFERNGRRGGTIQTRKSIGRAGRGTGGNSKQEGNSLDQAR